MAREYGMGSACGIRISETDFYGAWRSEGGQKQMQVELGSWVIVAEDDAVLRLLFCEALTEKGLQVLPAANGLEALELYRKNADRIWLVIADIIMPGIDGLTAAVEMRKINDEVYFLFMSGLDFRHIGLKSIKIEDIPNSNFFLKPFAFKDVINRIQTLKTPHP